MSLVLLYFRLLRRIDCGRIKILSTSQTGSSVSDPSTLKMKLHEMESPGNGPICNRAVKNPFLPSNEYSPFSMV